MKQAIAGFQIACIPFREQTGVNHAVKGAPLRSAPLTAPDTSGVHQTS